MPRPKSENRQAGFTLPAAMIEALDGEAKRMRLTRTEVVRDILTIELNKRGLWPPKPVQAA